MVNYRYQIGRRSAPAFSQATAADLENNTTWKGINEDLEKEGVDPAAIAKEKPFIKKWIDDVILAEDTGHNDETTADDESVYSRYPPPTSEGDQDHQSSYTESALTSPWSPKTPARIETDRTLVDRSPPVQYAKLTMSRARDTRSSISSQARRKSSDQTPRNQQIQANLETLLRMNSGASKELMDGLIGHVFTQLDTSKRGIFPDRLEAVLIPVIASTRPAAKQRASEILEAETTPGSRIDGETFARILSQILESANAEDKAVETKQMTDSTGNSRDMSSVANKMAYHWLLTTAKDQNLEVESLLPWGWESDVVGVSTKFFHYTPHNVICHRTVLPRLPVSAVHTFANMLLLSRRCRTELDKLQELWESHDELDEQYLTSSLNIIEDVREAAQKFEVFSSRKTSTPTTSLDDILGQAESVDMADAALLGQLNYSPVQELHRLQHHAFRSLQSIIDFLIELSHEGFQSGLRKFEEKLLHRVELGHLDIPYNTKPPSPGQSHSKMENQASLILADADKWYQGSGITLKACRNFAIAHPQLSERAREALSGSKRLYAQTKRCKHFMVPGPISLVTDKFIVLRLEQAEDFPKGNKLFRAGPPDIEAMIYIDNIRLSKSKRPAVRTQTPQGKDIYRWNSAEPYHISVGEQCPLYIHIHNTKRCDRADEGFMGLVAIDVASLPTGIDCEPVTIPLKNSFAKPGVMSGRLTLRVHWCPLVQFVRSPQSGLAAAWARKDTADDRFYFEDLRRDEGAAGARTAVFERWSGEDALRD